MVGARAETHLGEVIARDRLRVWSACKLERQRHVLERRHGRHEMERLEHDADIGAARQRQLVLAQGIEIPPRDLHMTRRSALEPAEDHQQRCLSEPDGPAMATDWPRPTASVTPLRISTGPARLESVRRTSSRRMMGLTRGVRLR